MPPPPAHASSPQPEHQPADGGAPQSATPPSVPNSSAEAPQPVNPPQPKRYVSTLALPGEQAQQLPNEFAEAVLEMERLLDMPVWLFIQDGNEHHELCPHVEEMFFKARHDLPQGKPIALLIESPGGSAESAYLIAKLLQRRCGSFIALVANWAKSAATLLALGASEIILSEHGQLGPLDVQIFDADREDTSSALNETQALERLHQAGLEAFVNTLYVLQSRTNKRIDTLLPHALKFVAESMRPLYEKVDVVQYTSRLRDLKVAEEYAVRLLSPHYPARAANRLAQRLVEQYPDHGFVIDFDEAKRIGMRVVKEPTPEQIVQLDKILLHIRDINAFGRVVEA